MRGWFKFSHFFNFSKCHKYSPSEPTKTYDKTVSRKAGVFFNPEQVLRYVEEPDAVRSHEQLVQDYLEVCAGLVNSLSSLQIY